MPTNFQHISHVGWDPNKGFDLENVDPKLKQFFSKAGVSERELQDKDTRDFIYDFIGNAPPFLICLQFPTLGEFSHKKIRERSELRLF